MAHGSAGTVSRRIPQRFLLEAIQQGESFVYAIVTREGAVKVGVSGDLMSRKKSRIGFGGTDRFVGFMPGDYEAEQEIHRRLAPVRIYGTREYYYPMPEVVPVINEMRDWMGVKHLNRRDLPRLAQCTFHRRVQDAQRTGASVFS